MEAFQGTGEKDFNSRISTLQNLYVISPIDRMDSIQKILTKNDDNELDSLTPQQLKDVKRSLKANLNGIKITAYNNYNSQRSTDYHLIKQIETFLPRDIKLEDIVHQFDIIYHQLEEIHNTDEMSMSGFKYIQLLKNCRLEINKLEDIFQKVKHYNEMKKEKKTYEEMLEEFDNSTKKLKDELANKNSVLYNHIFEYKESLDDLSRYYDEVLTKMQETNKDVLNVNILNMMFASINDLASSIRILKYELAKSEYKELQRINKDLLDNVINDFFVDYNQAKMQYVPLKAVMLLLAVDGASIRRVSNAIDKYTTKASKKEQEDLSEVQIDTLPIEDTTDSFQIYDELEEEKNKAQLDYNQAYQFFVDTQSKYGKHQIGLRNKKNQHAVDISDHRRASKEAYELKHAESTLSKAKQVFNEAIAKLSNFKLNKNDVLSKVSFSYIKSFISGITFKNYRYGNLRHLKGVVMDTSTKKI